MLVNVIGTLLFLATALGVLAALIYALSALVRGQRRRAGLTLIGTLAWLCVYLLLMVVVSLLTPQTVLPQSQERCFDEMCFSVTSVMRESTVGAGTTQATAQGIYYVLSIQLRNASLRTPQKPDHPAFYLVDQQGHRYLPAASAQLALGQQPTWDQRLQPGERQTRTVIFDMPPQTQRPRLGMTEGTGPGPFIIGDEQSLLHPQTQIQLAL